ncbi:hypothetical protein WJX77_010884 [Trebouxia sp. C0004]
MACCGVSQSKLHTKILGSALPLTLQTANKFQGISWQDVDGKCIQFGEGEILFEILCAEAYCGPETSQPLSQDMPNAIAKPAGRQLEPSSP